MPYPTFMSKPPPLAREMRIEGNEPWIVGVDDAWVPENAASTTSTTRWSGRVQEWSRSLWP